MSHTKLGVPCVTKERISAHAIFVLDKPSAELGDLTIEIFIFSGTSMLTLVLHHSVGGKHLVKTWLRFTLNRIIYFRNNFTGNNFKTAQNS
jgi:hypothetical protein